MKKVIRFFGNYPVVLVLALLGGYYLFAIGQKVFAVDTATPTNDGTVTRVSWSWTAGPDGSAEAITPGNITGTLASVTTTPATGATAPANNYDVYLEQSLDSVEGGSPTVFAVASIMDRSGTATQQANNTNPQLQFVGKMKITIRDAGAGAQGTVVVLVTRAAIAGGGALIPDSVYTAAIQDGAVTVDKTSAAIQAALAAATDGSEVNWYAGAESTHVGSADFMAGFAPPAYTNAADFERSIVVTTTGMKVKYGESPSWKNVLDETYSPESATSIDGGLFSVLPDEYGAATIDAPGAPQGVLFPTAPSLIIRHEPSVLEGVPEDPGDFITTIPGTLAVNRLVMGSRFAPSETTDMSDGEVRVYVDDDGDVKMHVRKEGDITNIGFPAWAQGSAIEMDTPIPHAYISEGSAAQFIGRNIINGEPTFVNGGLASESIHWCYAKVREVLQGMFRPVTDYDIVETEDDDLVVEIFPGTWGGTVLQDAYGNTRPLAIKNVTR